MLLILLLLQHWCCKQHGILRSSRRAIPASPAASTSSSSSESHHTSMKATPSSLPCCISRKMWDPDTIQHYCHYNPLSQLTFTCINEKYSLSAVYISRNSPVSCSNLPAVATLPCISISQWGAPARQVMPPQCHLRDLTTGSSWPNFTCSSVLQG